MSSEFLHDREKALEDSFFFQKDRELLDKLKRDVRRGEEKTALKTASGITDDKVLESLLDAGIGASTAATVTLVPLVAVAWSNGVVHPKEREAVLQGAHDAGMSDGDPSLELLEMWLDKQPSDSLFETWKQYVQALAKEIGPAQSQRLKEDILNRTQQVAMAAGGILGLGKVDALERQALNEIKAAFDA